MTGNTQTAIPQAMREIVAKNIAQARAGYDQMMDSAQKAQEMMIARIPSNLPSNPALQGLIQAQERAIKFARQNVDAGFLLADELTNAAPSRKCCKFRAGTHSCRCRLMPFTSRSLPVG